MRVVAIDTETHLIRPGRNAPELVCVSWADDSGAGLYDARQGAQFVRTLLTDDDVTIVGHNIAFDLGVLGAFEAQLLPLIFAALAEDRVTCTMLRERLGALAAGRLHLPDQTTADGVELPAYSLAGVEHRRFGVDRSASKGTDAWRMRYHELDGVPLSEWPAEARDYAVEDAAATLRVYHAQAADADAERILADEYRQARKAFPLRLVEAWGLRTDRAAVDAAAAEATATVDASDAELLACGVVRPDGTQDMAALRAVVAADYAARGRQPPVTPTGAIRTDADTLRECVSAPCVALVASQHARDLLSDWLPLLRRGETMPVHARFESLLENGRTSTRPNLQNLPRKGVVRPCFVPRSGHVLCSVDYSQLELCALAQVCLWIVGHSSMADAIRRGDDLHSRLGARIQGVSYETFVAAKKARDPATLAFRQVAKPVNFGFGGGMGPERMADAVWKQTGVRVTKREAEKYRQAWLSEWPEMVQYFRHIRSITQQARTATLTQFLSGRVRGACSYTQAANGFFSALANDGAGDALFAVSREMYAAPSSPLWGSRIVSFVHDEIVAEVPIDRAHEAGERLSALMNEVMQQWIPDVPISSEPALMSRLHKGADTVRDGSGRLVVWEPTA